MRTTRIVPLGFLSSTVLAVFALIACAGSSLAARAENPRTAAVFKAKVEYPELARRHHITGSGVYILNVDRKGNVTSVSVGASTGSPILDGAAIRSLKRWKFRPGAERMLRIPLSWSLP